MATTTSVSSLTDISTVLEHLGFVEYLNNKAVIELATVCSHLQQLMNPHINKYFNSSAVCCKSDSMLKIYSFTNVVAWGRSIHLKDHRSRDERNECTVAYVANIYAQPLRRLSIHSTVGQPPFDYLPPIKHLKVWTMAHHKVNMDHLPITLTHLGLHLDITVDLDHLPPALTHLNITVLSKNVHVVVDHLPPSLTHIEACGYFNEAVDYLPCNLKYLALGSDDGHYDYKDFGFCNYVDYLPPSLVHLKFGRNFNAPLDNLPQSLVSLSFSQNTRFKQPIDHLPSSLRTLRVPGNYKLGIMEYFPTSLKHYYKGLKKIF